jgi:hypothetical protein
VLHRRNVLPDTEAGRSGSVLATLLCLSNATIFLTAARGSVFGNRASRLANAASTMEMTIQPGIYVKMSVQRDICGGAVLQTGGRPTGEAAGDQLHKLRTLRLQPRSR